MRILAIDTTNEICSVALYNEGTVYAYFKRSLREHTKYILPLVKKILARSNITLNKLDALAFSRGPGSFTGTRIGIGVVQGLALGAKLPVISVSTLATLAQGAWRKSGIMKVLTAIDAQMDEVYWAEYILDKNGIWHGENTEIILKTNLINQRLEKLSGNWIIVGDIHKIQTKISPNNSMLNLTKGSKMLPEAIDMLPIACNLLANNRIVSVEYAQPIYLSNKF